jgi:hypothetical protein
MASHHQNLGFVITIVIGKAIQPPNIHGQANGFLSKKIKAPIKRKQDTRYPVILKANRFILLKFAIGLMFSNIR